MGAVCTTRRDGGPNERNWPQKSVGLHRVMCVEPFREGGNELTEARGPPDSAAGRGLSQGTLPLLLVVALANCSTS